MNFTMSRVPPKIKSGSLLVLQVWPASSPRPRKDTPPFPQPATAGSTGNRRFFSRSLNKNNPEGTDLVFFKKMNKSQKSHKHNLNLLRSSTTPVLHVPSQKDADPGCRREPGSSWGLPGPDLHPGSRRKASGAPGRPKAAPQDWTKRRVQQPRRFRARSGPDARRPALAPERRRVWGAEAYLAP